MPNRSNTQVDSSKFEDSSLVSKLLKLQSCCEENKKVPWMTQKLICLQIPCHGQSSYLRKTPINTDKCKNYIAVSYRWKKDPSLRSYIVADWRFGSSRPSKVRDVVLDRAIKYAKAMGLQLFWIDQECIGQEDSEVKQQALNSMDLVYKNSAHPLGLLDVTLEDQGEIDILQSLIAGDLLAEDDKLHPKLRGFPCEAYINHVLRFLDFLSHDEWWTRAWIFQEEYLSSTRMHLLIRCRHDLLIPNELGPIPGEIRLNASGFREGATRYLLAVKRVSANARRRQCARLLKTFGKYSVQYLFQMDFQHRAMSSRIIADLHRRGVGKIYDRLPIAANSNNYAKRLSKVEMEKLGYSMELCNNYAKRLRKVKMKKLEKRMELCILAMCLLNGELIRNCDLILKRPEEMGLGQYLHYSLFNRFDPPVLSKGLSYLKTCRLHNVFLSPKGIHAQGQLWTVVKKIDTTSWLELVKRSDIHNTPGPRMLQCGYLLHLLSFLRRAPQFRVLAQYLETYLDEDEDLETGCRSSSIKEHRDTMASTIVRAIKRQEPLFLVQNSKSRQVSGILTGLRGTHSQVFTSWYEGKDADERVRQSRISIEVEAAQASLPLLKALQWVNGLVIFEEEDSLEVVFRWPRAWI